MPTYFYTCPKCEKTETAVRRIADRHDSPECHGKMKLTIVPTAFRAPQRNMSYYCQGLGQPITSERERKYAMDKAGVVDYREFRDELDLPQLEPAPKQEVPGELKEAMQREGLSDLLT